MNNINFRDPDLENVINELLEAGKEDKLTALTYKGKVFFSGSITMDAAYMEVHGMTKEGYDQYHKSLREVKKIGDNAAALLKRGESLIYPERIKEWNKYVLDLVFKNYTWEKQIESALNIMEGLESDLSYEEAVGILLDQNKDRASLETVREIIFNFSKLGPEFYLMTTLNVTPEIEELVKNKTIENEELEQFQSKSR